MSTSAPGKSLWEYILLAISGFATLVQVLGLISQSLVLFAQPSVTATFVIIVLVGTIIGFFFVLIRKKSSIFLPNTKIPYYTRRQKIAAGGLLVTNLVVSTFVLVSIFWTPCFIPDAFIPPKKFGILVGDFTEGLDKASTHNGVELAQRTLNALKTRLASSSLGDKVEVKETCAIRNKDEAYQKGQTAKASLVLWGNVPEFAQDTFEPSFTFTDQATWPYDINPLIFNVELNQANNSELPSKISARTTVIAAFTIGLIYLREAKNTQDYELALREFTFAIENTEPDSTNLVKGSDQEVAVKRTLSIFYVMRGRAYTVLGDNQHALDDYSAAETQDPDYPGIYIARGNYYYGLREFSQAEPQYRQALSRSGYDSASAYYGLGNTLFYLKRYQESVDTYSQAINLIEAKGEDPSGVRVVLGVVYNSKGDNKRALEQLNMVKQSTSASSNQKERANNIIASILTPISTSTITLNTPTMPPIHTPSATLLFIRHPNPTLFLTGIQTPTLTLFPTLIPTASATEMPALLPTETLFPPIFSPTAPATETPTVALSPTLFPTTTVTPSLTLFPTGTPVAIVTPTETPTATP
ncbi:MAG: tetratricopeptide repeat protein [Anaerolineales bacterium]